MMHVIYATDPRAPAERIAKPAREVKGQVHVMEKAARVNLQDPNVLYAAEWDGKSPKLIVRKGRISDLKMAYLGWPMVT